MFSQSGNHRDDGQVQSGRAEMCSYSGLRCGVLIAETMGGYSLEGLRCGVLVGRLRCGVHMERKEGDEKFAY